MSDDIFAEMLKKAEKTTKIETTAPLAFPELKPATQTPSTSNPEEKDSGVVEFKFIITFRKYPNGMVVPGKIFPIGTQTVDSIKKKKKTKKKFKESKVTEEEVY